MKYSVVPNLLYDLLAISKWEISIFERLFILYSTKNLWDVHDLYLADLYVECGCYSEAINIYDKRGSYRKMGDLAWTADDLESAKKYYSTIKKEHKTDWDRLFRLALQIRDWEEIVKLFFSMDAFPISENLQIKMGLGHHQFVLGSSAVPIAPIRKITLLALVKLDKHLDQLTIARFRDTMGINEVDIQKDYKAIANYSEKDLAALEKQSRPRFLSRAPMTIDNAMQLGRTIRSKDLMSYISTADDILSKAKISLNNYLTDGNEDELNDFITKITGSGISSITESIRFEAMNLQCPAQWEDFPDERIIKLLSSHLCMNKRHFGQLLALKLKNGLMPNGEDIVTGMFQMFVTSDQITSAYPLDYERLSSAREWASQKCQDWSDTEGLSKLHEFRLKWLSGKCSTAKTLYATGKEKPLEPRDTQEWHMVLKDCQNWLAEEWRKELEDCQWKAETQLYLLVKKAFKEYTVIRHAAPTWLSPQHYDIFIPELELAIEYMGQQHYEPIEFFGGQAGFVGTIERDEKKTRLSRACGVKLHYVKYDEKIKEAMTIIKKTYGKKSMSTTAL